MGTSEQAKRWKEAAKHRSGEGQEERREADLAAFDSKNQTAGAKRTCDGSRSAGSGGRSGQLTQSQVMEKGDGICPR